jgi:hypothetical protein
MDKRRVMKRPTPTIVSETIRRRSGWPALVNRPGFHRGSGYWETASKAGVP